MGLRPFETTRDGRFHVLQSMCTLQRIYVHARLHFCLMSHQYMRMRCIIGSTRTHPLAPWQGRLREEEEVLTELMDGLCKFFARAGKERPPGSSSSETPRKRKAPPPTLSNVEQDVQQRTEWRLRKQCVISGGNHTKYQMPHESPFRSNQPPKTKKTKKYAESLMHCLEPIMPKTLYSSTVKHGKRQ